MFKRRRKEKQENTKTTPVSFALTEQEAERLYSYCYKNNFSVSSFVRKAVLEKLDSIGE